MSESLLPGCDLLKPPPPRTYKAKIESLGRKEQKSLKVPWEPVLGINDGSGGGDYSHSRKS